jgi:RNA polymerase sigma-70 factor (ECF subfamily)
LDRTDEELVAECLSGDTAAYGVLVKRHHRKVVAVAWRALRDGALAEDLAQEVFLRAYRSLPRFQVGRRFSPWLMAITSNRIRDYMKTVGRRREVSFDLSEAYTSANATPLDRAVARQSLAQLQKGISDMPEETQEVLRLRFILGLDYDDIAEELSIPLGTVKSRISRARTALRALMGEVL